MAIHSRLNIRHVTAVLLLMGIWACAPAKPFTPPKTGEIPDGPGLFSKGQDGVVVFDDAESSSQSVETPPADDSTPPEPVSHEAFEEFEAFQQWLQWKKEKANSAEYEAFKQWQQWRRYQEWKRQKR